MPTAVLRSPLKLPDGRIRAVEVSKTVTHNNARLYHEGGQTYEYVGLDPGGNRIYRDTKLR